MSEVNWSARFEDPIPGGIVTLQDAANYILRLKKPDDLWEKAGRCLMIAAEHDGHPLLVQIARIAFMRALERTEPPIGKGKPTKKRDMWRERRKARR